MSTFKPQRTRKSSENLKERWTFFYGTLVTLNTAPVDLELKDDTNPVLPRPYPVSRVNEAMFRKEVKILVKLGVLEEAND